MNVREALETRPWFRGLRLAKRRRDEGYPCDDDFERDMAVKDFEKACRAAYAEGVHQTQDCYTKDKPMTPYNPHRGVTAGVAAMVEQ